MKALDLFAGAGAVSRGLVAAGFDEVVGVDIEPMPRYPFARLTCDALALDVSFLRFFDFIWASPPCQAHTALRTAPGAKEHADLIPATRALLLASGVPFCIENVVGAPLIDPVCLCGSHFGLGAAGHQLRRHRLFECSFPVPQPVCRHRSPTIGIYGGHVRNRGAASGGRGTRDFIGADKKALALEAMGLTGTGQTMDEISQAVPPAYSKYIAQHALIHIRYGAALTRKIA